MKGIFGWSSGAGQTINRGAEIMRHAKWQNSTMLVKAAEIAAFCIAVRVPLNY